MDEQTRLELLKQSIGAAGSKSYDDTLLMYLDSAKSAIEREGITLNLDDQEHNNLIIGYAAWIWRQQRENPNEKMPRWVRYGLNNLVFSQKGGDS